MKSGVSSQVHSFWIARRLLGIHQAAPAVEEFQKILDHPGLVTNEPIGSLAHLALKEPRARRCTIAPQLRRIEPHNYTGITKFAPRTCASRKFRLTSKSTGYVSLRSIVKWTNSGRRTRTCNIFRKQTILFFPSKSRVGERSDWSSALYLTSASLATRSSATISLSRSRRV